MNLRDELHALAPSESSSQVTGREIIRAVHRRRRYRTAGCLAVVLLLAGLATSVPLLRGADATPDSLIAPTPRASVTPSPTELPPVPADLGLPRLAPGDELVDLQHVQVAPDDRTLLVQAETSPCLGPLRWQVRERTEVVAVRLIREPVTSDGACALIEESRAQPVELMAPLDDRSLFIQDGAGTRVADLRWRGRLLSPAPQYHFTGMVELSRGDSGLERLSPSGDDVIIRYFSDGGDCPWSVGQFDANVPELPAVFRLGPEGRRVTLDGTVATYRTGRVSGNAVLLWTTGAVEVVVSGECRGYSDADLLAFARSLSQAEPSAALSSSALQNQYRRELVAVNQGASRPILTGLESGLVIIVVDTSAELTPGQEQFLVEVATDDRVRIERRDASGDVPFSD